MEFMKGDYSQRKEIGDAGRYDIRIIAKQFLELEKAKMDRHM